MHRSVLLHPLDRAGESSHADRPTVSRQVCFILNSSLSATARTSFYRPRLLPDPTSAHPAVLTPLIEGPAPLLALFPSLSSLPSPSLPSLRISPTHLALNALLAFALNAFSLALMRRVGSLSMALGGTAKDLCLIVASVGLFGGQVSGVQVGGYGLSVVGLGLYRYAT